MGDMQTANSCLCANPEHLTFFKKILVKFPGYVGSLDGQMPHKLYYTSPQNVSPKIMIWEWIRTLYRKSYMKCIASKQEYMNKVPVVLSTYEIYQDFERLDQYLHQKEFLVLITRFCKISGRVRCVLKAEAQTKLQ